MPRTNQSLREAHLIPLPAGAEDSAAAGPGVDVRAHGAIYEKGNWPLRGHAVQRRVVFSALNIPAVIYPGRGPRVEPNCLRLSLLRSHCLAAILASLALPGGYFLLRSHSCLRR